MRLGDLDALKDELLRLGFFPAIVKSAIERMPTVDAVPVVRCKDCKHWHHIGDCTGDCTNARFHLNGHADPSMKFDDFCSCGERRNDDG